jgi:hypothetical protein
MTGRKKARNAVELRECLKISKSNPTLSAYPVPNWIAQSGIAKDHAANSKTGKDVKRIFAALHH